MFATCAEADGEIIFQYMYTIVYITHGSRIELYIPVDIYASVCVNIWLDSRLLLFARLINWLLKVLKIENKI